MWTCGKFQVEGFFQMLTRSHKVGLGTMWTTQLALAAVISFVVSFAISQSLGGRLGKTTERKRKNRRVSKSVLVLVAMPGAPSRVLAPSSKARSP